MVVKSSPGFTVRSTYFPAGLLLYDRWVLFGGHSQNHHLRVECIDLLLLLLLLLLL